MFASIPTRLPRVRDTLPTPIIQSNVLICGYSSLRIRYAKATPHPARTSQARSAVLLHRSVQCPRNPGLVHLAGRTPMDHLMDVEGVLRYGRCCVRSHHPFLLFSFSDGTDIPQRLLDSRYPAASRTSRQGGTKPCIQCDTPLKPQ